MSATSCREIAAGNSLDVLEIDAASNRGIDQVRELRDMVRYAPAGGRYKVVILDEAHMLTDEASNALLKTLEEPPEKVVFVMATTQPEDLVDTIRSRSQHFHFRALSFAEIAEALKAIASKEELDVEPGALAVMARAADGSLRDALSLIEQARAYCGAKISEAQVRELLGVVQAEMLDELVAAIENRSAERALGLVHRLLAEGQNLQQFCREAISHFRNVLVARVCGADSDLIAAPAEERPRLARAAAAFSEEDLTRFFQILLHTEEDLRRKPDPRLHLEMGLLRLVNAARLAPLEEVLAELSGNAPVRSSAPRPTAEAAAAVRSIPAKPATAAPSPATAPPSPPLRPQTPPRILPSLWRRLPLPCEQRPLLPSMQPPAGLPRLRREKPIRIRMCRPQSPVSTPRKSMPSNRRFSLRHSSRPIGRKRHALGSRGGEIRLYFPTENRALADLLQARDNMEKLRTIASRVLGQPLRVCVKLEASRCRAARHESSHRREWSASCALDSSRTRSCARCLSGSAGGSPK